MNDASPWPPRCLYDPEQKKPYIYHTIDAKLYLFDEYDSLLNELESILDEEAADYEATPEGLRQSDRGEESRQAQACLQRAVKALGKVVDGKRKQELMDIVHENLRFL